MASPKLADIVSCVTSDGYLQVRKEGKANKYVYFGFYSKYKDELKMFNNKIFELFGVRGAIREVGKRSFGSSLGCLVLNAALTRVLNLSGVPANSKVTSEFLVPEWILYGNKNIKASFLRSAFSCEGSIGFDKSKDRWQIRLFSNRIKSLAHKGIEYMNSYRFMLKEFGIETTNVFVDSKTLRQDGTESIGFCFKILKPKSILNYADYIGFDLKRKNDRLERAVIWARNMGG